MNPLGQKAQVLRNDGQVTQSGPHRMEQFDARALPPHTVTGCCGPAGNGIITLKSTEMVNTNNIIQRRAGPKAVDPPAVAIRFHGVPAVQRVAPQLPIGRKSIGRAACHLNRLVIFIQQELLRSTPHIGRIPRYIDGNIPNDTNPALIGIALQGPPLPGK